VNQFPNCGASDEMAQVDITFARKLQGKTTKSWDQFCDTDPLRLEAFAGKARHE
jgi:hypothetical protein